MLLRFQLTTFDYHQGWGLLCSLFILSNVMGEAEGNKTLTGLTDVTPIASNHWFAFYFMSQAKLYQRREDVLL
ncbi:hypothetical protein P4E94_14930, partial [Pontiellaceae bacterium B12219]|nr:hypothetical protein [Pontiellaceae bacterium B12219]